MQIFVCVSIITHDESFRQMFLMIFNNMCFIAVYRFSSRELT
jgi:hypothetical protein